MPGRPPEIQRKVDRFIDECRSVVKRWPALVVILMHEFRRCYKGRQTDLDYFAVCGSEKDRLMWGDGELRYLISK